MLYGKRTTRLYILGKQERNDTKKEAAM